MEQRPMMAAFLDALGIAHENGLIQEDNVIPDAEKLAPAVAQIAPLWRWIIRCTVASPTPVPS